MKQRVAAARTGYHGRVNASDLSRVVGRADRVQRHHAALAVPYATFKRFGEANAGGLAASIAYYGLFSLFPLLLVLTSVTGMVLRDRPELQERMSDRPSRSSR